MPSNLKTGGGAEIAVMQYAYFSNKEKYSINILQTDHIDKERFSQDYVSKKIEGTNLYTISDIDWRFSFLKKNKIFNYVYYIIFRPIFILTLGFTKDRKTLNKLKNSDIIYLFQNEMQSYFLGFKGKVIGHNGLWVIKPKSLIFKLVSVGIMWHRIEGFRLFPFNRQYSKALNRPFNFILTNGIDTSTFFPASRKEGIVKFLFVGRTDREKGIDILLDALNLIPESYNFELHIAGIGDMVKDLINSKNKSLIYHGMLKEDSLFRLYRECDVFLFPTKWEPFGLVILEALASGLHVIVSDVMKGAFDDFEKLGVLDYIINNPESYARSMISVIENINKIRKMGFEAHRLVKNEYDIKIVTDALFEFFSSILKN